MAKSKLQATRFKCVHGYADTIKRTAQPMNQINAPIRIEIPIPMGSAPLVNTLASMIAVRPTAAIVQTQYRTFPNRSSM